MKKILFGNNARQKIKAGVDKCCDVVKVSMGKEGKNVLIYNGVSTEVINDGVSIAREVNVKDEVEQAGIQLAKQCANQTNEDAGDGTTTTLVLLQAILGEIIQEFQTSSPRDLRIKLFKEAEEVLARVKVKEVKTKKDIYNLALTSSLDGDIATLIADIYDELGKDTQISIEETSRNVLEKEIVRGIKFESKKADKLSEDNQIIEDCRVLVLDKVERIEDFQKEVTEAVNLGKKDLLVIANTFSRPVLVSIMSTRDFNVVPIEYKMFTPLEDVKNFAGNTVEKAIITKDEVTLIGGSGKVDDKVSELKEKLEKEESQYEKENIENRIAKLMGKIAVIRVGKNTDVERTESVLKVEDAIGAVKGAYECGYSKGAGKAITEACGESSEMFQRICEAPYKQICANAGLDEIEVPNTVIDSFKTIKHSLLNAISTATSILMVESALIKESDDE